MGHTPRPPLSGGARFSPESAFILRSPSGSLWGGNCMPHPAPTLNPTFTTPCGRDYCEGSGWVDGGSEPRPGNRPPSPRTPVTRMHQGGVFPSSVVSSEEGDPRGSAGPPPRTISAPSQMPLLCLLVELVLAPKGLENLRLHQHRWRRAGREEGAFQEGLALFSTVGFIC